MTDRAATKESLLKATDAVNTKTIARESYMTDELGPLPFCPGCGHERLLKDLNAALVKLQLDPDKVVVVSDIGCIGLADRYFDTNAFHGLHGRSLTYATGLKLARPELTIVVLMGDGGCGIGGAHLLSSARRNLDITLIVANNFNYGMTGGQHSVTTPGGGITATTPGGNIEGHMDICATVAGAGATWAYRGLGYDSDLSDRIVEGIQHSGFAILDVWELCTAYYMPRNDYNKKELYNLVESTGFETGLIVHKDRPEFGAAYREQARQLARFREVDEMDQVYNHSLTRKTGIVIAGSAGQKIKSAAGVFSRAAIYSGLKVTQKDDYPITIMTGHSVSEINLSPEAIEFTAIDSPDYFLVFSEDGLVKTRSWIEKLPADCVLIADELLELPDTAAQVVLMPIVKAAKQVGKLSIGVIALAALLERTGIFPIEAFVQAIGRYQSSSVAEVNLRAINQGRVIGGI
jgi:pyruvate/2-oxoacid:ferredoxin oxidoreductase beta subunit/Pyruvate/2-oxoacid:ferredoxin oxidoreductase gamma subunit